MTSFNIKIEVEVILVFITMFFSLSQVCGQTKDILSDIKYSEELFVQTDRDIYIVGESVLFKVFKLNGITRTPGNLSKIVYVELLDINNNPLIQIKIGMSDYSGKGELRLPAYLQTGNYLIRSCTKWMQNFSQDMFSYRRISVINPFEDIRKAKIPASGHLTDSIAFYPESGFLVEGIKTIVGFRCFDKNGNPAQFSGKVIDYTNDTLCEVKSWANGCGFFTITPSGVGEIYLQAAEGMNNQVKFSLPNVSKEGIGLSLKTSRDDNLLRIELHSNNFRSNNPQKIFLIYIPASTNPFKQEILLETDKEVLLQKDNLPAGLAHLMIVDDNGSLLAGRWLYNERIAPVRYRIRLPEKTFSTREKVRLGITAIDHEGIPVGSDLMISVVKSFALDQSNCGNMPQYNQLPILATMNKTEGNFNINDYLIYYSDESRIFRDDSMETDIPCIHLPELRGNFVCGQIISAVTGQPLKNEAVVLSVPGEVARCRFTKTDNNGYFSFVVSEYGLMEIVIQPLSSGLDDYIVKLRSPFPTGGKNYKLLPFYLDSSELGEINKAIISTQIKNMYDPYLKSNLDFPVNKTAPDFYGEPVDTVLVSQFIELGSVQEIVKELVPGVSIYRKDGQEKFKIVSDIEALPFEKDPLMLVDGVPVADINSILNIDPGEIKRIEVLRRRYLVSDIILEGIIHFITKKGNLSSVEFDKPVYRREFTALEPDYIPYFPDYSGDTLSKKHIPDFRNTLYWNPDLCTFDSGETQVEFFTSDEPGDYTIIVEGITSDGKVGRSEESFQVREPKSSFPFWQ